MRSRTANTLAVMVAVISTLAVRAVAAPPPTIIMLNLLGILAGDPGIDVSLRGTGFVSGSTAYWNGSKLDTFFVSPEYLTVTLPANLIASPGTSAVKVVNPDGGTSNTLMAVIPALTLGAIAPSSVQPGGPGFTLTVSGIFQPKSIVQWNGTPLPTAFVQTTELTATVTASLIANPGTASIRVMNPSGVISGAATLTIAATTPTIATASPNQVDAGGQPFNVTILGTGFIPASTVSWSGTPLATTFGSVTQLTAAVPAALSAISGRFNLTVTNPGGLVSDPWGQMYIQPVITSISPPSTTAGSSNITLSATGVGFTPTDSIRINVSGPQWDLSAAYVSSSNLRATVPAAVLAAAGPALVSIVDTTNGSFSRALPFTVLAALPVIASLSPASTIAGSPAFALNVTGTGFASGSIVQFNGSPQSTTFLDSTRLSATMPAPLIANPGSVAVSVVNPGGTVSSPVPFTINAPVPRLTGCNPGGVTAGGPSFTFTVQGTGFVPGAAIVWSDLPLATTFVSSTQLTAVVPASLISNSGAASYKVVNPGGAASDSVLFFITALPAITSIAPSAATASGPAFTLTVYGANFVAGSWIQWNGELLTTTFVSSTQLSAMPPARLFAGAGTASIAVVNPGGYLSGTVIFTITAAVPAIAAYTPATVTAGGPPFTVTVNGTGFVAGAVVQWNGSPLITTFVSTTQLTASAPASLIAVPGAAALTVVNPGGALSTSVTVTITPPNPTIASLLPASAAAGGPAFNLAVTGAGYLSGAIVQWNGAALATAFVAPSQLNATVPAGLIASPGTANITAVNPGGAVSPGAAFTINAATPSITQLSPGSTTAGGAGFFLTLTGTGYLPNATVQWNGSSLATAYANATQLTATVPASLIASPGTATITVVSGGATSNRVGFTVTAITPVILTAAPNQLDAGGPPFTVTVSGTGFVPGSTAYWSGTALDTYFVSTAQLNAIVPSALSALSGRFTLTVTNPGGGVSNPWGQVYIQPVITSISPASAGAGSSNVAIVATGAGFTPADAIRITVSGPQWDLPAAYISSTSLRATIPAAALAAAGPALVSIVDPPNGLSSHTLPFTVDAAGSIPTISSLNPLSALAGGAGFTLNVTGTGFTAGATVRWNGTALQTTFTSSTQLAAAVPASLIAAAGSAAVTVAPPSGPASLAVTFSIAASPTNATITGLSPRSATAGGLPFTLSIAGAGFLTGATAQWNGTGIPTTYVGSTQLNALVSAGMIVAPASALITVTNPTGPVSAGVSFEVTAAVPSVSGFSPASATAGGAAFTLAVNGSGFLSGATVQWMGTSLVTAYVNPTQLAATVPSALIQSSGNIGITVLNPNGAASSTVPFTINPPIPTVSGISPNWTAAGATTFTLTVSGSGFLSGATVRWNASPLATTYIGPTQLTAQVTAALLTSPGTTARIAVANPEGTISNAVDFGVVGLTVLAADPQSSVAGGPALTLTVRGRAFLSGASVYWNGSPLASAFVNQEVMTASVPASLIAAAGTANLAVANPGGALSNSIEFVIAPASLSPVSVTAGGIVNAASSLPAIAPGSLISIWGTNLASHNGYATDVPLPTAIDSTSVLINNTPAPLLFVSPNQINAQVPFETAPGTAALVVRANGASSAPMTFETTATAPGVLTTLFSQHALAQNAADWSLNSAQNPALPGQYVIVYVTGQGLVDPPIATGLAAPSTPLSLPLASVQARIGGQTAPVAFAGLSPGLVGLLQVNLLVPAVAAGGQTLELTIGGVAANPTLISVGTN